jgi:hypothetical protein
LSTNTCLFPPQLDDEQLLDYLDERNVHQETAHHLEKCPFCRDRAKALERFQKRLGARLYRATCPSPMELGEFHLRMLGASQMLIIGQHLRGCPHCAREVSQLEDFLGELTLPITGLERMKVLVAELVSGKGWGGQPSGFPSASGLAGLRGNGEEPFVYQADDIQIIIEVQDDTEQPGLKMALGLVTGLKSNGFMIETYQDGKLVTTTFIDGIGNFLLTHLSPGLYDFVLLGPDTEIRIQSLTV